VSCPGRSTPRELLSLGERDERVRRHRRRGCPHHPRRERRRGEDGRRPVHPEERHSTDRRDARSGQLPVLSLTELEGGRAAALQHSLTNHARKCGPFASDVAWPGWISARSGTVAWRRSLLEKPEAEEGDPRATPRRFRRASRRRRPKILKAAEPRPPSCVLRDHRGALVALPCPRGGRVAGHVLRVASSG